MAAIAANASGSAVAMRCTSNPPMRWEILSGPANADSMVTCWSSSMPTSSANGSVDSSVSASGSPVNHRSCAMSPSWQPGRADAGAPVGGSARRSHPPVEELVHPQPSQGDPDHGGHEPQSVVPVQATQVVDDVPVPTS